jgi:hypothetical protein
MPHRDGSKELRVTGARPTVVVVWGSRWRDSLMAHARVLLHRPPNADRCYSIKWMCLSYVNPYAYKLAGQPIPTQKHKVRICPQVLISCSINQPGWAQEQHCCKMSHPGLRLQCTSMLWTGVLDAGCCTCNVYTIHTRLVAFTVIWRLYFRSYNADINNE